MNYKEISRILGNYLLYFSLILCIPLGVAIYFQYIIEENKNLKPNSSYEFFLTFLICLGIAFLLRFLGRSSKGLLYKRESIILVMLIWFVTSSIGALPFYLTNTLKNPLDAFFEAASGFTTTGCSVISANEVDPKTGKSRLLEITTPYLPNVIYKFYGTVDPIKDPKTGKITATGIEAVGYALLFWRNFMQWLGGMGIVVLFLTVLPALGIGGKFLYQIETTGPIKEGISPRIKETASLLWKLYLSLTIIEVILLLWTNMNLSLYDAVSISLTNISTGGFSNLNNGIAGYNNANTEWIIILFMILGSISFSLYFHCLRGKFYKIYVPDFFLFIGSLIFFSSITVFYLVNQLPGVYSNSAFTDTIRAACFQAVSFHTCTGYYTVNYDAWPFVPQMILLLVMFIGGMAGSTSGGIKTPRFYILFKIFVYQIEAIFRPDSIKRLKIQKTDIDNKTAMTVLSFFSIFILFTILGTSLYIFDGIDPETALGLMAGMITNAGSGFRALGPTGSFSFLSPFSKILSTFWMLIGRLEIFAVIILFLPSFWKSK